MSIEIEKGIPVPIKIHGNDKWPWRLLEIGDSFFAPGMQPENLSSARANAQRKLAMKFMARSEIKDGVKGVRVWRIE